ncbi:alpha/beta hydrolase-fold protein [Limosilactobacillus pontis]|uniref:alpha/beta hydrolase n=1 Tax=Limosilactobacillus pontis TaxID=35787 RepID=UPI0025A37080|nr:alpha/beta hydrolase-fold protein [Limosilactobacillus pontis]MDM8332637.1 alpha/beta hydrolase-fold protein [Limosilactobacillus pontis]
MALLTANIFFKDLMREVPLNIILPNDSIDYHKSDVRCLYLLHGLTGDYIDWVTNTPIKLWAEQNNYAVVMPSGDNAFYINDSASSNNYHHFISQGLPEMMENIFNFPNKRSYKAIAGLSMGGYGALWNGLASDNFAQIGTFSAAIIPNQSPDAKEPEGIDNIKFKKRVFGDSENLIHSKYNPVIQAKKIKATNNDGPRIFMTCGKEDSLCQVNRNVSNELKQMGLDITYQEWHGKHNWKFWNESLNRFLQWLN